MITLLLNCHKAALHQCVHTSRCVCTGTYLLQVPVWKPSSNLSSDKRMSGKKHPKLQEGQPEGSTSPNS